jgi:NAD(P)-dependent dehydrogenase (short-subunit alcohol dehydrogenase family)
MPSREAGIVPFNDSVVASDAVGLDKAIPYKDLERRVVVITGGASGFGAAIASELAKNGAFVIIGDINTKGGEAKVAELRQQSGDHNHHFIPLDATSWSSQHQFFRRAASLSPHQGMDCVIANAGIALEDENAAFEEPPDYFSMENPPPPQMKTYDVNLTGVLYTTNLALSYLARNPSSSKSTVPPSSNPRDRCLILVSSIAGLAAVPKLPLYAASKHGVVGLFRSLRLTSPVTTGVRVNMINPYFVNTNIIKAGAAVALAGAGMAEISDVVDAVVRMVADKGVVGRALMIGARGTKEEVKAAGLGEEAAEGLEKQAIWDYYGHDFEQTDVFVRKVIGLTNLVAAARGWTGWFGDIFGVFGKALGMR